MAAGTGTGAGAGSGTGKNAKKAGRPSPGEGPVKVLLAEDEESFIEALVIGLTNEGFRVTVARDGNEALQLFEETLRLRKSKLGPAHSDTLNSMNNLAAAYWRSHRLDQSVPLFEETLKLSKAKLGFDANTPTPAVVSGQQ